MARQTRGPFWQRWFVDFLLLAVAGYGYYLLMGRQSILTLGEAGDVFSDPLLLLVPALFIFAASLIFLRIFPFLINGLTRVGGRFFGVSVLLGLRQIGRQPGQYTRLVLLLTLTLALGTFAASVAKTLDRNYNDRVYYQTGSDLLLVESGTFDELSETWSFQPVGDHLDVQALQNVARVFRTTGNANITGRGRPQEVKIMGTDPPDFARVAWWREDFADRHFVALLNGLAGDEKGAIVDRKFLNEFKLKVGDSLVVNVKQKPVDFTITGVVDYWPTLWPDTERFFVVNLDYLFDQIGASPYDVWAETDGVTPPQQIAEQLRERDFIVSRFVDARETALRLRDDPGRTGIFGILTVGFIVAALLTVLGFMLYSFLSAKRRMQQLGILRAMGLSIRQLISLFLLRAGLPDLPGDDGGHPAGGADREAVHPLPADPQRGPRRDPQVRGDDRLGRHHQDLRHVRRDPGRRLPGLHLDAGADEDPRGDQVRRGARLDRCSARWCALAPETTLRWFSGPPGEGLKVAVEQQAAVETKAPPAPATAPRCRLHP